MRGHRGSGIRFASRALRFFLLSIFLSTAAWAAPFEKTFTFKQPDGAEIELWGQGDEFHAVFETLDGYTVLFDQGVKAYVYATLSADGNDLKPTTLIVGKGNPPARGQNIQKHLRIRPESAAKKAKERFLKWDEGTQNSKRWEEIKAARRAARQDAAKKNAAKKDATAEGAPAAPAPAEGDAVPTAEEDGPVLAPPSFTTTGLKVGLTLLIDFSDDPATIPQASIIDFCNGDSYTGYGNNGSVKKYYQDNSNGLLTYTNVVTVYIRMAQPKTYYNNTAVDCGTQGNILIQDAIAIMKALPNYATEIAPTFANLTTDGGGNVLACNVYYAGGNGGVWSYGLWPHSWSLYNVGAQTLVTGKQVFKYQITNIGSSLELGTFCHENGHMLCGYPDIYDYGYDSKGGAGVFCLMNSGGHGTNPVQICAYLKEASGWATVIELTAASSLTASVSSTGADFNKFYRYQKPGVPTEYYLVENRQKALRDAYWLPGGGICIWHIDELGNKDNQSMVYNPSHLNYECTLMQADGLWHFQNNVNAGDSRDLYYLGNAAAGYTNTFNDGTTVSARWWDGTNSNIDFSAFSASSTTMTFSVSPSAAYAMTVSPESAFQPTGPQGGPFSPLEMEYTVTNNGSASMEWGVAADPATAWLTITPSSGTLAGKSSVPVTVSVNANANALAAATYNPQLVFTNVTGGSTLNRAVSLVVRPMAGFAWDTIPSPRYKQSPFSVNLRAVDSTGALFTPFTGTATLAGVSGASGQTVTVGAGAGTWTYPLKAASHDARTQTIYLQSEIGAAQQFTGLALNVAGTPGQTLNNFTIRMQHTTTSKYNNDNGAVWLSTGWTTVYQGIVTISQTGWVEFPFSAPFSYDGTQNLMVDISFNNASGSSDGTVLFTTGTSRAITFDSNSTNGDPLTWSARNPAGTRSTNIPNIKLLAPGGVTITPTTTGNFTGGVWSGVVTVNEAAASMFLRATSAALTGDSNAFVVEDKTIPTVNTWPTASAIAYGQAVGASTLTGGAASVAGSFSFTSPAVTPPAGTLSVPVIFTPTDTVNYGPVEGMVSLVVNKATPSVSAWPTASALVYGQALSASTLSGGSASVAGSFAFVAPSTTPPLGTYAAAVRFTPADAANFNTVEGTASVSVGQATPTVTAWPTASAIVYGQALSASTLSGGTASVAGAFAFSAPATTPDTGTYSAAVTFTPTDTTNYSPVGGSVTVVVAKAKPVVTAWPTASAIEYGQVIADSTLTGGSASVPGTFVFAEGGAGFTGSDAFTFKVNDGTVDSEPATVALTVATVGNPAPAPAPTAPQAAAESIETTADHITDIYITCDNGYELYVNGTPLGTGSNWQSAQRYQNTPLQVGRNVVAVKGIDAGGIAALLVELVVDGQRIGSSSSWKVSLTAPSDWKDPGCDDSAWATASDYGAYGVSPWGTGASGMPSGTPAKWIWSSNNDLNDTVYFRYVIDVISPNASPVADAQNVAVERNTPTAITLTGSDPDSDPLTFAIVDPPTYGALSGTAPNVTYTPPSMLDPGLHEVAVLFIPTDTTHYNTVSDTVELEVLQGSSVAVTEWPSASDIVYGQPLSASTLTGGTASVPGAFAFRAPATVLNAGTNSVAVTFTPTDTGTYNPVEGSVSVVVAKATPVITAWPTAGEINYGQYFSASTLSGGSASTDGTFAFDDPAVLFTGQDAFTFRVSDGTLVSDPATVSITVGAPSGSPVAAPAVEAAAPTTTVRGDGYTVVTFAENGSWTVPSGVSSVEVLVVGGGGGGGASTVSGGGGAGGVYYTASGPLAGTHAITVGAGGSIGGAGANSAFGNITAFGGQPGQGNNGSGGASGGYSIDGGATQGVYAGGGPTYWIGGGGGAGQAGYTGLGAYSPQGNSGGNGLACAITGTSTYYGGGGGNTYVGGYDPNNLNGGLGGGGAGDATSDGGGPATAGVNGLGGGGGGGRNSGGAAGGSGVVIVAYLVTNQGPTATAQNVTVEPNTPKAITLEGTDPDGDPLTFEIVTQPTYGTLSGTVPTVTYTPPASPEPGVHPVTVLFTPADTANYNPVSDTVNVTVLAPNTPPVANAQSVTAIKNKPVAITLTGSDPDSDPLTFAVVAGPSSGTLSGTAPNLTYTPAGGYLGADAFTFKANDGTVDSAPATVSINVRSSQDLYLDWVAETQLEEGEDATTDNPSGDGLSNLIKYALGLDPTVAVENPIQTEEIVVEEQVHLQVSFTPDPNAEVLIEGLSAGRLDDPEAWSESTTVKAHDEQTGVTTVRDTVPVAPGAPRFLKLRFSLP